MFSPNYNHNYLFYFVDFEDPRGLENSTNCTNAALEYLNVNEWLSRPYVGFTFGVGNYCSVFFLLKHILHCGTFQKVKKKRWLNSQYMNEWTIMKSRFSVKSSLVKLVQVSKHATHWPVDKAVGFLDCADSNVDAAQSPWRSVATHETFHSHPTASKQVLQQQ